MATDGSKNHTLKRSSLGHPFIYECYIWTTADILTIAGSDDSDRDEKTVCESKPNNIFTRGNNKLAPGCGPCWCCQRRPTEAPTAAPTTEAPTAAPTAAPITEAPTAAPTAAPITEAPTAAPTTKEAEKEAEKEEAEKDNNN